MLHRIAFHLTTLALNHDTDNKTSEDTYIYGFEIIVGKALTYIVLLIVGAILNLFWEVIVFTFYVAYLRGQTGGYHLNNSLGCVLCTITISVTSILLAKYMRYEFAILFLPILIIISIIIIYFFSPINHPNLSLNKQEARKCAKYSRLFMIIELLTIILFILLHAKSSVIISACLAIVVVALLIIVAKIKKQEVPYYE